MKRRYQIAIDGPAGSGKSTIAKLIASKFDFLYIDSGAMYRAVTLYMIRKKLLEISDARLKKYIKKIKINFINKTRKQLIYLNGKNVSSEIRSYLVNKFVSKVSAKKVVRTEMVKQQRDFAKVSNIVMDGRDIGSAVFPNADLKVYLTASASIRAKRRKKELKGTYKDLQLKEVIKQIQYRDSFDSTRSISPLCKPCDAIVIDTTNLKIKEVLEKIYCFIPNLISI